MLGQGLALANVISPQMAQCEQGLPIARIWSHRGTQSYEHLVIFGDSYSTGRASWAGQIQKWSTSRLHINNFARDGDTVQDDLQNQLQAYLLAREHEGTMQETAFKPTLYVFWLGINDCGYSDESDLEEIVEKIFDCMDDLYIKVSARHFLLIDVPPLDLSPAGRAFTNEGLDISAQYTTWNQYLLAQAKMFASNTPRATVSLLSSYLILSAVLEQPDHFGLQISGGDGDAFDANKEWSDENEAMFQFWEDDLHISEAVHAVLARSFALAMSL